MNTKKKTILALSVTLGLALSSCSGASNSDTGGLSEITVAITTASLAQKEDVAVFAVGSQLGYYEEEGIEISTVNADGSSAALQAVASGSADVSTPDAGSILGARASGVPIVAIGGLVQNWPWQIAVPVDSDIQQGEDLDGKNIGVISLASGSAPYARAFAEDVGLDPASDVNLLPVGVGGQAASALTGGDVDALALYGQAYTGLEQAGVGLRYLENSGRFDGIRSLTFMTAEDNLEKDTELYEGFLRASYKALVFSVQNPEAAVRLGYEEYPSLLAGESPDDRIQTDTELLIRWLESAVPTDTPITEVTDWGAIADSDWDITQEFAMESGQIAEAIPLEDVWDPSLLEAANNFDQSAVLQEATDYQK